MAKRPAGEGFFNMPPDWQRHWAGMPEFEQSDLTPHQSIVVHFRSPEDRNLFAELIGRNLTSQTRSVWYPREEIGRMVDKLFVAEGVRNPRHPVYVISKGRWESRLTVKALERMGVPYHVVVEPQEFKQYAAVIDPAKILKLPFSNLGQGSIPARNWVWQHAIDGGHSWHWILDDNIDGFYRLFHNIKTPVGCGNIFRAAEDFVDRYENVAQAGFNYFMFASRKTVMAPYYLNTRIYSCILIRNDVYPEGKRWRGRYNEDTDLSLRILKDGLCTVLFNAFLCFKTTTMTMKGGNTDELYQGDGRLKMAESLRDQHPDVVTITHKWGRWQHHVDYSRFKRNKPNLRRDALVKDGVDNFGMYLRHLGDGERFENLDRLLLIGQAPGKEDDPPAPLEGKIGRRIASLAGLSMDEYLDRTERTNLFDEWPGKSGKGDAWNAKFASRRADEMLPSLMGRRVLFVGRNVAAAFGHEKLPWLTWRSAESISAEVAVIPHPSGIVLWWNEEDNREKARGFLRSVFEKRRQGERA